jgi:DeoR family glycerol-3-phosphate regulon repressor
VARGSAVRMHGAVGLAGQLGEAPFERRMRENAAAKQAIARDLARRIPDGAVLMLDTGTTTSFLARALVRHRRLTVVTNSTDAARILSGVADNRVQLAGGALRGDSGAVLGGSAVAFARRFRAGIAVISAGAVDPQGVQDFDADEADFARALLDGAARRVVAADRSKFLRPALVTVCPLDGVDELCTDAAPPAPLAAALARAGTRLCVAPAPAPAPAQAAVAG